MNQDLLAPDLEQIISPDAISDEEFSVDSVFEAEAPVMQCTPSALRAPSPIGYSSPQVVRTMAHLEESIVLTAPEADFARLDAVEVIAGNIANCDETACNCEEAVVEVTAALVEVCYEDEVDTPESPFARPEPFSPVEVARRGLTPCAQEFIAASPQRPASPTLAPETAAETAPARVSPVFTRTMPKANKTARSPKPAWKPI